jgi:hypothetical protein
MEKECKCDIAQLFRGDGHDKKCPLNPDKNKPGFDADDEDEFLPIYYGY